jgi:phage terminase large subunit
MKRTNRKVYIDYNPTHEFWAHDKLIHCPIGPNGKKEFGSVQAIRSTHLDNMFLTPEQHEDIENIADPELYKAYAKGFTAKMTGLVFPNFTQVAVFPEVKNNIWGMDLGYTNDPTVIIKIALPTIGRVFPGGFNYIGKELIHATGLTTGTIYQTLRINGYRFPEPFYMDHDDSIKRELRALRVNAIHAIKGPGSLESSILHVRGKSVGYIGENAHKSFKRYSFEMKDGKSLNIPKHEFSHVPDAFRYPIFTHAIRTKEIKNEYTEPVHEEMETAA